MKNYTKVQQQIKSIIAQIQTIITRINSRNENKILKEIDKIPHIKETLNELVKAGILEANDAIWKSNPPPCPLSPL